MIKKCRNKKCDETLNVWSGAYFCPACKYLSRRAFALGCFFAGLLFSAFKLVEALIK